MNRLLMVTSERPARHDTHTEWLASAMEALDRFKALGMLVVKVQVDVNELADWCCKHGYAVDGKACSQFVSDKLASGEAIIVHKKQS
jgi:hypothetical protein